MKDFVQSPDPNVYFSPKYLVLDFETTTIQYGNAAVQENSLVLTCWKYGSDALPRAIWGSVFRIQELVKACEEVDFIVAHNAKMELKWLQRAGLDLTKVQVFDTMVAEYVLLGNRKADLSLDGISTARGIESKEKYVQSALDVGICPSAMPRSFLLRRCAGDVRMTEAVFKQQLQELHAAGLLPVMYTRCFATPMLADMEMRGMQLDHERVLKEYKKFTKELTDINNELHTFTGGVNPNSPKQVATYLYDVLQFQVPKIKGKEVRATDADTLASLPAKTADQRKFLELKAEQARLHAACSKALNKFQACCEANKLLLGQFNQTVTATHRLSASGTEFGVQFQNMAREFKPLFKSRFPGWKVAELDGAQIEFRVAGFLGQDYTAYRSIIDGEDVHTFTAQTLTAAGQKTDRQTAKSHTFKPLYGGQSGTKAERAYYEAFRKKYPGIAQAQRDWQLEVLRTGSLRLASGLRLYFPGTRVSHDGYITNSTQICNYPVQSLATAEITLIAITYLWHAMTRRNMEGFMVNTVHDSVICEIPEHETELLYELGVKAFTEDVYKYLHQVYNLKFNFPLGIGFKVGDYWSEGKESKSQVNPPFAPPEAA